MRFGTDKDFDLRLEQDSLKHLQYNGLTDPNLASFFASPVRRKLLMRQKLVFVIQITPDGLVNEFIVRQNITKDYATFPSSKKFSLTPLPMVRSKRSQRYPEKNEKSLRSGRSTRRNRSKDKKANIDVLPENRDKEQLPKIQPLTADKFKEILNNRRKLFL